MQPSNTNHVNRRHFLATNAMGIGGVALAWLLNRDGLLASPTRPDLQPHSYDLTARPPHFQPKARAMISMFMQGGPSHVDLLDHKPVMRQYDGQTYPGTIRYDNPAQASSRVLASPWSFRRHGESGLEISELLPHLGEVADDITIIRSMRTGVNNHLQSINALNNGRNLNGRPVLGSWITYALGCETQNLPAYVVLSDPASLPVGGVGNFTNGWLPSIFQGTVVRAQEPRILNLDPPAHLQGQPQRRYLDYLNQLNQQHLEQHPGETELEARIASYELAARMQTSAREALDIRQESAATQRLYGIDVPATRDFGTRCLIARRLVERGVRFVQIFTRNQFWDHHNRIYASLPRSCQYIDRPAAALVRDLKSRGLLDSTLVHWGGEMGRMPVIQNDAGRDRVGRDHNTNGFSMWLAGGGIRRGHTHGATDDFGHQATVDVVHHYDYHATLLHLFGLDHRRVIFARNGQERTLTDSQPARVVQEILA